ncbi:MAG: glycosyltransferase 87 family protein [Candidatus Baltobacteraceae bacterium]
MLLVLFALVAAWTNPLFRPHRVTIDLNTFYCAGMVVDRRADPYRAEPLGACERRAMAPPLPHIRPGVVMPAPLPPYALAPFALLALLPYSLAIALWSGAILAAAGATVFAMRRLTGLSTAVLLAAFVLGTLVGLELGQVAPIATAAVALSAYFASRGKGSLAAIAASCGMIEPHVALPACLALFIWLPKTRVALASAGAFCLALSLAFVGPPVALEYLREVLPGHALAEVNNHQQLSLTYVLHRLGAAPALAVHAGEWWYGVMLVLGLTAAGRFARHKPELVPSLPVAFAVFGGAFVHAVQTPAALPAALILLADTRTQASRRLPAIAVIFLALPFIQFFGLGPAATVLYGAVALILAATLLETPPLPSLAFAFAAAAVPFGLWTALQFPAIPSFAPLVSAYDPHAIAEVSWMRYTDLLSTNAPFEIDIAKLPTWFALASILAMAAKRSRGDLTARRARLPGVDTALRYSRETP